MYAAIETSIEAPVVTTLNFRRRPPNFRSRKPKPTIGAVELAHEVADPGPRLDRLVAALPVLRRLGRREHRRLRRLDRLVPVGLPVYDPWPIHSSPPTYVSFFQSGTETFNSSIASRQAASAAARCGADTAMTTLVSPIVDAADSVVDRDLAQLVAIDEPATRAPP